MYKEIDELIACAMKNRNEIRLNTLKLIKSAFVKSEKDGVVVDDIVEAKILTKMISQYEDSITQFKSAGRLDLVEKEEQQLNIVKEFAPKEVSEEEIIALLIEMIQGGLEPIMKNMKTFMSNVKERYPLANGKLVSDFIKNYKQ